MAHPVDTFRPDIGAVVGHAHAQFDLKIGDLATFIAFVKVIRNEPLDPDQLARLMRDARLVNQAADAVGDAASTLGALAPDAQPRT